MQSALQRHRLPNATKTATLQSTANLSRPGFFLGKLRTCHMRYIIGWIGCARTFCLFHQKHVTVGKTNLTTTTQQQTAQAACTTTSTGRHAHRTAHFVAARIPPQPVYISAPCVGCGLLTALWLGTYLVSNSRKLNEATTPARKK